MFPAEPTPAYAGTRPAAHRMRARNLAVVIAAAYASPVPLSRAELAERTAVSRPTVTRLVDDLVRVGLLREGESVPGSGPGRPSIPLTPSGAEYAALGLQVNVRRLTARLLDLSGVLLWEDSLDGDFAGSDPYEVLPQLIPLAQAGLDAAQGRRVVGAGLALPGLVDAATGHLLRAPNLGWRDVPAADVVRAGLAEVDVRVDNEATFAALTAARTAPGRPSGLRDFLYLSGEVGIGGCAVLDGQVLRGRHGWAGEFGHVAVAGTGRPCPCGSAGCLESYAGRNALLLDAGMPLTATPADIAGAADAGDARAVAAIERAADALAVALGSIVNVLDIPTIVFGGHLAALGPRLVAAVQDRLTVRVLHSTWVAPRVIAGSADPSAAATGAAYVLLERLLADPAALLPITASAPAG